MEVHRRIIESESLRHRDGKVDDTGPPRRWRGKVPRSRVSLKARWACVTTMTSLSTKLQQREEAGYPVRVGIIGAGKFGSMLYGII